MKISRLAALLAALASVFILQEASYSDVFYVSGDSLSVNCIVQDNSGGFTVSYDVLPRIAPASSDEAPSPEYGRLFAFKHNGRNRLLVSRLDAGKDFLMVYDVEGQPVLLASRDLSLLGLDELDSFAEHGNNILIAGTKKHEFVSSDIPADGYYFPYTNDDFIIELDPDTLESVGQPYHHSLASHSYSHANIASHKGLAYAVYYLFNGEVGGSQLYDVALIDISRDAAGSITSGVLLSEFVSCGGKLYASTTSPAGNFPPIAPDYITPETIAEHGFAGKLGIYRVDYERMQENLAAGSRDFVLQDYSERIVTDAADNVCSDGGDGIYYLLYDYYPGTGHSDNRYYRRYVGHWDGQSSRTVYDFGEDAYSSLDGLCCDNYTGTLFTVKGAGLVALVKDSSGQFQKAGEFEDVYRSWAVIPREPAKEDDVRPVSGDEVLSGDMEAVSDDRQLSSSGSSGGGCNSMAGVMMVIAALALYVGKR